MKPPVRPSSVHRFIGIFALALILVLSAGAVSADWTQVDGVRYIRALVDHTKVDERLTELTQRLGHQFARHRYDFHR